MKNALISADGEVAVYAIPDAVADDLPGWADRFRQWMLTAPEAAWHRLATSSGEVCLAFNEKDFIEYLNRIAFPGEPSALVEKLGYVNPCNCPEPIASLPWYNF